MMVWGKGGGTVLLYEEGEEHDDMNFFSHTHLFVLSSQALLLARMMI